MPAMRWFCTYGCHLFSIAAMEVRWRMLEIDVLVLHEVVERLAGFVVQFLELWSEARFLEAF